jgi:uncharacterized protein YkwD
MELLNEARTSQGLAALSRLTELDEVARSWSRHLAYYGLDLAHNPNYADEYPAGWTAAAENVAWIDDNGSLTPEEIAQRMHDGWMDSDGHRANMLGSYTHVGIGVAHDPIHGWYLTQNFAAYGGSSS